MTKLFALWRKQSWPIHALLASSFWGAVAGIISVWPALLTVLPLWAYAVGAVVLNAALAAAKYFDRPGTE